MITFRYGVDRPHGVAAVDYAYSPEGMWRDLTGLTYGPNYYRDHDYLTPRATVLRSAPPHRPDRVALIRLARVPDARYTARDKNGRLLGPGRHAFHEHNGRGARGEVRDQPFHQFWFDDNWLARVMARTYGRPEPDGLADDGGHIRWRILTGDLNWTPHDRAVLPWRSGMVDRLALDGLYYLSAGRPATALGKWRRILWRAGPSWRLTENYHLGLAKILAEQLLAHHAGLTTAERDDLLRHAAVLRAAIIAQQQVTADGKLTGWTSAVAAHPPSLMNIETLAVNALALGAGALRGESSPK